ncbi:hypothetical protein Pmar_PMAR023581 [Perkinsus marinus ATCC 50983]|uniref:Uncharacterized protein n=1 Tax=Perkinsus marinus (strain ATCC 50983 / TXsc) TaxID=423536 RepID=C5KCR1_PERM5|nr:hypothetical protein Pmar_PMAR023581 [Perkinsus marinus ATCC 50983]EER17660.1 hypothetical protein Pmar_PMAR023581 [Perkinsus marinus ATCC 50983]|eukprot:XP_002785864.1 hypothetical protein Pmar_PMAR023581 [Perkinsus marinus ATCC 50983]
MLTLALDKDSTVSPRLAAAAGILKVIRGAYSELCQEGWERAIGASDEDDTDLHKLARGYLHAHLPQWLTGAAVRESSLVNDGPLPGPEDPGAPQAYLQSLSFVLGVPMAGNETVIEFDPERAADGERERQLAFDAIHQSSSAARSGARGQMLEPVARSFSSGDATQQHTVSRVHVPSGISRPAEVIQSLADLDLFYSDEGRQETAESTSRSMSEASEEGGLEGLSREAAPTVDLVSLFAVHKEAHSIGRSTGEVVTGEDTESSEESDECEDA